METWQEQRERRERWVENLKAGDKVLVVDSHGKCREDVVEKVTPAQIVLVNGGRYARKVQSDWNLRVGGQLGSTYLKPETDEPEAAAG